MTAKKAVLQLSVHEERLRKKVMVTVSRFPGVTSITMDDKAGKLTVVGDIDVSCIVMKLRKRCNAEIVTVEDVKPPEKKPDEKKPDPSTAEILAFPFQMSYPYQYNPSYAATYYHHPYAMEQPNNTCSIM